MNNFFNTHILPMVNMAVISNKNSVAIKIASTPDSYDAIGVAIGLFYVEDREQICVLYMSSDRNSIINDEISENLEGIYERFRMQHLFSGGLLQPIQVKTQDDAQEILAKEITETLKDKDIKYIKNVKQKRN